MLPAGLWKSNVHKSVILVILAILVAYGLATAAGWMSAGHAATTHDDHAAAHEPADLWAVIPFTILLGAIAVLPLVEHTSHWWESNLHKFYVAGNLALITLVYLVFWHPEASIALAAGTLSHVVVTEYIPFIVLLFSLFTISGGIRITGDLRAHPSTNTAFIAAGGLLASFIGTTGAAMLLIRPLLETNAERKYVAHTVVFFIFVVCNCGGLLLPIGDPPLFLGYLNGVDFLWTLSLWRSWLFVNTLLLASYFAIDHFYCYRCESEADVARDETQVTRLKFAGVWPNGLLLLGVIFSVGLLDPAKAFPGTDWHPWFYLREMMQLGLVAVSLLLGPQVARDDNNFDYLAIVEVAVLFIGLFVAMQPALEILNARGVTLDTVVRRNYCSDDRL